MMYGSFIISGKWTSIKARLAAMQSITEHHSRTVRASAGRTVFLPLTHNERTEPAMTIQAFSGCGAEVGTQPLPSYLIRRVS